jgi:hypothetical protein
MFDSPVLKFNLFITYTIHLRLAAIFDASRLIEASYFAKKHFEYTYDSMSVFHIYLC